MHFSVLSSLTLPKDIPAQSKIWLWMMWQISQPENSI